MHIDISSATDFTHFQKLADLLFPFLFLEVFLLLTDVIAALLVLLNSVLFLFKLIPILIHHLINDLLPVLLEATSIFM